jgi:8-oxo-dGTP diphosphatase
MFPDPAVATVTLAFRCTMVGGQTHLTDEARKVAWLTVDEAPQDMPEARAVRVTDALASSEDGPAVRIHDGTRLL